MNLDSIIQEGAVISAIKEKLFDVVKEQLTPTKEGFDIPEAFGMYRSTGGKPLGVVGKDFTATQPVALLDGLVDCGLDLSQMTYKELKGGSKIYFDIPVTSIEFDNTKGLNDITDISVRVQTGFDGNTSTSLYIYTHRLVCTNGMKASFTEFKASFKNTKGNQGKVLSLCHDVSRAIDNIDKVKEIYQHLDKTQINQAVIDKYLKQVANIDKSIKDEWTTRKTNIYNDLMESLEIEFKRTGYTAFGLLQGTTYYTNHVASGSGNEEYILLNSGSKMNDKAMKFVTELVK